MLKARSKNIKKAIKAFIHRVDLLENAEDPEVNGFDAEYKLIQEAQARNKRDNVFSMDIGKTENNLKKNRYKDILPYDAHRVVLSVIEDRPDSDYINASKLRGVRGTGGYIATQGPLAITVSDFWRMIWECNVEIVFMACRIVELGKIKCKQYWNDQDKSEEFGNITVFTELDEKIMSDCIRRRFRVTKGDEVRQVTHYHYSGWPDHGIPDDAGHIRDMIGVVRQTRHNDQAPLLVHCSAGCGRTGAIIAIDYVWTLLEEGMFDETFNLFDLICTFREQRVSLVQTTDQYALVNKVLKSLCEEWLTRMATHTYENVKLDQASEIDGDNPDIASTPTKHIFGNGCDDPYQDVDSVLKLGQSPTFSKSHEDGHNKTKFAVPSPPEGRKDHLTTAYENLSKIADKKQDDLVPRKSPTTSGERAIQKTADSGITTKLAQTSDLAGNKELMHLNQSSNKMETPPRPASPKQSHFAFNGLQSVARPLQSPRPQQLQDIFTYSPIYKIAPRSPATDADTYSHINKIAPRLPAADADTYSHINNAAPRSPAIDTYSHINKAAPRSPAIDTYSHINTNAVTAPAPPGLNVKPQLLPEGAINKLSPLKLCGAVPTFLIPQPQNSPSSSGMSEYSTARDVGRSVFTAYETVGFPSDTVEVPAKSHSRTTSSSSPRQLNSGGLLGFKERLPRVRGPVPIPQAWN